jgi:hypothetical protein
VAKVRLKTPLESLKICSMNSYKKLVKYFFPNVVVYCCMLHNLILNGRDEDVESLMTQLEVENHE